MSAEVISQKEAEEILDAAVTIAVNRIYELEAQVKTLTAERDGALAMASGYMRERDKGREVLAEMRDQLKQLEETVAMLRRS